jgi:tRNA (adenine57-N1/adenine58-N1)-methyltransferase
MVKVKSKIMVIKGKRQYFEDVGKEVTVVREAQFYIADPSKDYSTKYGTIKKADMKKDVVTANGKECHLFDASFIDDYRRIKRAPQIIPLKDIGYIISKTGIGPDSIVVEGGTGSGALALFIARYCKKVYSYEIDKENLAVAKENAESLGIKNVMLKNKSMYDGIDEKDVDLVCLDLPEPWKAIAPAGKSLKRGGFIVSYSPTIVQTADFVNALVEKPEFIHLKTVEVIEREWEVDKRKVRPASKTTIHSGFITLGRKI